ncbi:hypothetical protein YC2023_085312 [Brassica napus]
MRFSRFSIPLTQETVLFGAKFPALYVIGDSLVDSGNNNHLETIAKSNFPPHGSDFEGGKPTGRFSNGKTIADYIAIYYGLPLVPAYMELSEEQKNNTSTGINYASASCGILPGTGKQVGKCLSMSVQVDLFKETIDKNLKKKFKTQSELTFLNHRPLNTYTLSNTALKSIYRRLHGLGERKFFINNLKPLGCYPNIIAHTVPRGSCDDDLNLAVALYNAKLRRSLSHMKQKFSKTSFLYSDYFNFMLGLRGPSSNHASSNLMNSTSPCCPSVYDGGVLTGCRANSSSCKMPNTHIFFDPFHPTQLANFMYAIGCFQERKICHVATWKLSQYRGDACLSTIRTVSLIRETMSETDTKLANKVLIAKEESIEEGAERFRRDLLHNLSNHLVSVRKAYCLLIDSPIEEHIQAQKKHKYDGVEPYVEAIKEMMRKIEKKDMEKSKKWLLIKALNIHCLSSHCMQSTVHGVMSDDVARFLNLLTTTQYYFFIEMNVSIPLLWQPKPTWRFCERWLRQRPSWWLRQKRVSAAVVHLLREDTKEDI